jgi:hypothetical protein
MIDVGEKKRSDSSGGLIGVRYFDPGLDQKMDAVLTNSRIVLAQPSPGPVFAAEWQGLSLDGKSGQGICREKTIRNSYANSADFAARYSGIVSHQLP